MGFSRQGYWSELPFPSPGDLSNPGIKPGSPILQADALPSKPPVKSCWHVRSLPISTGVSQVEKGVPPFGTSPYDFLENLHS